MAWSRTSRHKRGYGSAWDRIRKQVLIEYPICQCCHIRVATDCDHIKPKSKGGTDDRSNLQALCKPCHAIKVQQEAAEAKGGTYRPRPTIGLDGWPT